MQKRRVAALATVVIGASMAVVTPAAAAEVAVAAEEFAFNPAAVQVAEGDTVTWTNNDPETHTVTADDGSFSLAIEPGASVSMDFDDPGEVPYFCKLHGGPGGNGMAGTVIVGDAAPPATVHITGTDNVARAISWSTSTFPDGAGFALLGRSDSFADSLASGAAQGKLGAPLLLNPTNALDARVRGELERLNVKTVYLLGGTGALSAQVANDVAAAGFTVRRVAGANRLETATAVAETFFPEATSALVVRAFGDGDPTRAFADALAAGSAAAATGQPVLFSETARLSDATKSYLQSHPIGFVSLVGGTSALSDKVASDLEALDISSERSAGLSRSMTAAVVGFFIPEVHEIVLVDGLNPNAWVDGFAAASRMQPVLLTAGDGIPGASANHIADLTAEGLVCGATVTATACGRAEAVRSLEADFPDVAVHTEGPAGSSGALGFYRSANNLTLCYDYFGAPFEIGGGELHPADHSVMVPLALEPTADDDFFGCSFSAGAPLVSDLFANPADYEAEVFAPGGTTVVGAGTATNVEPLGAAGLVGELEVPGPGDPEGAGFTFLFTTDTPGELCSVMFVFGLSADPTAAHIHDGDAGVAGPVFVPLPTPTNNGGSIGCVQTTEANIAELVANRSAYYVNVHTSAFPAGAIRAQIGAVPF